jgi:hypothetical protein
MTLDKSWQRLAEKLIERRVAIDPRYSNRRLFCDERGIDYRTVSDLERARRDNYGRPMLAKVEVAYKWAAGSVRQILEGGDPTLQSAEHRNGYPDYVGEDPYLRYIWDAEQLSSPAEREMTIRLIRAVRAAGQ